MKQQALFFVFSPFVCRGLCALDSAGILNGMGCGRCQAQYACEWRFAARRSVPADASGEGMTFVDLSLLRQGDSLGI